MSGTLRDILGATAAERAILSVCAVPSSGGDADWTLVHGTLLAVPEACAQVSWAEWRRAESWLPIHPLNGPLPDSFLASGPGWMLGRAVLEVGAADRWLSEVRANAGALESEVWTLLPAVGSVPALTARLDQPAGVFRALPGIDAPAAALVNGLSRPAESLLWRGVANERFPDPGIVEVDEVRVVAPTMDLVGIHITDPSVDSSVATACGLLVGRAEGRAWIRSARGSRDSDAYLIDVGWDPGRIELEDLELTHEEWLGRELALSTRFRFEDIDMTSVADLGSCTLSIPTLGRGISHGLLLHTLDGELLDRSGPYPLAEQVTLSMVVDGETFAPVVLGTGDLPELEERLERAIAIADEVEHVIKNGVQARMIADRQTAIERLRRHLERARGELLILDRYFGQDANEWRLLDGVPVPVRVLTGKLEANTTPRIANHVDAKFRRRSHQHERVYIWDGGGLSVGGSPSTFGQGPVRMTRLRSPEVAEWRALFESFWSSGLYQDVSREILAPMTEEANLEPLTIGEAFPAESPAGQWVVELSMAMNDIATLDAHLHDALDHDRVDSGFLLRLLCGSLREIWRLFTEDDRSEVARIASALPPEVRDSYEEVRALFVRAAATKTDPKPQSWAERYLSEVRNRTFHYPHVGTAVLRDALTAAASEHARVLDERTGGDLRPFQYADVVALHAAFGNIDEPELQERFTEIVQTAKRIASGLVPVVFSALRIFLEEQGVDVQRFRS